MISRERRDIILSVDRVRIRDRIKGDFTNMNLDRNLYIGGVPFVERGLVVYENFTGCIENMYLNHSNVIASFKDRLIYNDRFYNYEDIGGVVKGCPIDYFTVPVTFKNSQSHVKLTGYEGSYSLNVRFEFRTYEENGLLMYHSFSSDGEVELIMENARVKVKLVANDIPPINLDNFDQTFNDGKWHKLQFEISKNRALLVIDNEPMETRRILNIATGAYYYIGGGVHGVPGFRGCMRNITIDGNYKLPSDWTEQEYSSIDDIALEACMVVDRCNPNPCEHGGVCKQNADEFYCECDGTGYTGAVCHTSLNFFSCVHYKAAHPESKIAETVIDIDGSGPLAPFPVQCEFFADGRNITYVHHLNEEATKVDGFQERGSFQQKIFYDASMDMMEALINRSHTCIQRLGYDCKRSMLFNTPVMDIKKFSPFGFWVSRQNRPMDYWAGSLPGSMKCECGLLGVCWNPDKWCNCDSGHDDWLWDGGEITEKEYLPVRELRFGDTGDPLDKKEGRFSLGPLECDGDVLFDNIITFRKDDGVMELPHFDMGQSGDIYLEFKTTWDKTMVLAHSIGSTGDFIR